MKIIKDISDKIEKEISNANSYATCALNVKDEFPSIAESYYNVATAHMNNVKLLHDQVVLIIEAYRKDHGEPPSAMLMLYDILHKKHISDAAAVKGMLALYKES